jgi:hypothetical protein
MAFVVMRHLRRLRHAYQVGSMGPGCKPDCAYNGSLETRPEQTGN